MKCGLWNITDYTNIHSFRIEDLGIPDARFETAFFLLPVNDNIFRKPYVTFVCNSAKPQISLNVN